MGAYGNYGYSDYSYGGYPGYNRQSGSMLDNTSMSQAYSQMAVSPNLEASNVDNITRGLSDTYNRALEPPKKKGLFGKIGDFFKGIVKGFTNLVKSLADPKTWLMIAAMVALCMLVPGAGTALMMLGIGLAGLQIFKGVSSGNAEQVGEGTFNLGLAFVGGKSAGTGIKAGKGAEQATFTRAGTRVADAEKKLTAAKESSKSKKEIASAEKELQSAREAQARNELQMMSKDDRTKLMSKPDLKGKSADDIKGLIDDAATSLMDSRKAVQKARNKVDAAKKSNDADALHVAENNLANQEAALSAVRKNLNELYMGQRLLKAKEAGKPGLMTKTKNYLRSAKTAAGEHVMSFSGRPLTSVDGRTITYWSRTPKKNPVAAESEAAVEAATKNTKPWYKPWTWFKKPKTKTSEPTRQADASNTTTDGKVVTNEGPKEPPSAQPYAEKDWAIVPYQIPKNLMETPTVMPNNLPLTQPAGFWGKTKAGVREHGFSSFIHANMADDLFHPLLIQMGLPEQGLLG